MIADWSAQVLSFWFDELDQKAWFEKSETVDEVIRNRFSTTYESISGLQNHSALARGEPDVALASAIVLDQFPRNMFRGSARMFESDAKALVLAKAIIAANADGRVAPERRIFLYLPFEHSEALADQDVSVTLFEKLGDARYLAYAVAHRDIILRFGRFPHRNAVLGRPSTAEEEAFLAQPGSGF